MASFYTMGKAKDEVGHRYGRLVVIKRAENRKYKHQQIAQWLCRCNCGKKTIVHGRSLRRGITRSCGCLRADSARKLAKPKGIGAFNHLYGGRKASARRKDLEWKLTKDQFYLLSQQPCHYCGVKPRQIARTRESNGPFIYNGLDRVNNDRGYILDNVVPCCKTCNYAKRTMDAEEFLLWVEQVHLYQSAKVKKGKERNKKSGGQSRVSNSNTRAEEDQDA